ncbi:DUF7529 family protein [Natronorubrum daqingense]|uniref:Uncharacterized protein n=1 Tax=Natronorubrum daqingense TaxID=588898 RepID=A0A1N7FQE5_9EURY|nr:hypothetical protein [Natronorubrum daqingense]APX97334.1 hypothetical protein BB347_12315 [Natronorubrum daqingense]SIS02559.1 hypothetical protein SAMN05421809_3401 [Natronorubrum daqingense]
MTTETPDSQWDTLLEDARAIAEEYRANGWDAIVLEPDEIAPVAREERIGFDVAVSTDEYQVLEDVIERGNVTITAAEVYYRPPPDESDRRLALAVERDDESETAVIVPLAYDVSDAQHVFETALTQEELLVHVLSAGATNADGEGESDSGREPEPKRWISFSHDDPSLFLEETDVREWTQ